MATINAAGLALIKEFEGCALTAYQDSGGVWTIGYGHTGVGVTPGLTITQAQADAYLLADLQQAETAVSDLIEIALTPNEFSALVSWEFNTGGLATTAGLALINERQFEKAWDDHFCLWLQPDPVGLARRRAAEKALFFTPQEPTFNAAEEIT